jgi:aminopeptidase N
MKWTSIILTIAILFSGGQVAYGQFTLADTLRGSITPERAWWDLVHYDLSVEVFPEDKTIVGSNVITYEVLAESDVIQIDLQLPLLIDSVVYHSQLVESERVVNNAFFITLSSKASIGSIDSLTVYYSGHPRPAVRAPWDGGISWKKDDKGVDFIASSCQGLGASVWWPCKDHMYDEVDSMDIRVTVPDDLSDISNGRLISEVHNEEEQTKSYHWQVVNPINNYGVNINIGNYMHWDEVYDGEDGDLDLSYWVLEQDEERARKHFTQVPKMLDAFEHWFGPYPFYEDGFKLVQVPYLGMEHQSSVTYGNKFLQGYLGNDLSGTGWGMTFDFIIVHEAGHEWFANNITYNDLADMWLHESFTSYSESLYVEYHNGKEAGQAYVRGVRDNIENKKPMIGPYGVNYDHYPVDVYYKGANMLNTLRTVVGDDMKWRGLLRGMNEHFRHQTIDSAEMEDYISTFLDIDCQSFFDQYLRTANIPVFDYYIEDGVLYYCWSDCVADFDMPVDILVGDDAMRLTPDAKTWQSIVFDTDELIIDENYYIEVREVKR